jgi:hypothetical protein
LGVDYAPKELLEFRYMDRFKISYSQLMDEPSQIVLLNLKIMEREEIIAAERQRKETRRIRHGTQL